MEKKRFLPGMREVFLLEQQKSQRPLPALLLDQHFLQEEELFVLMANFTGLPCVSLLQKKKSPDFLNHKHHPKSYDPHNSVYNDPHNPYGHHNRGAQKESSSSKLPSSSYSYGSLKAPDSLQKPSSPDKSHHSSSHHHSLPFSSHSYTYPSPYTSSFSSSFFPSSFALREGDVAHGEHFYHSKPPQGASYDDQRKNLLSPGIMRKYTIFPVHWEEKNHHVVLACAYGFWGKKEIIQELPTGWSLSFVLASLKDITECIEEETKSSQQQKNLGSSVLHERLYGYILEGLKRGVSDLHFHPCGFYTKVFYREDGLLRLIDVLHEELWRSLCLQLKVLSSMDITNTTSPQDGHFSLFLLGRSLDLRLGAHPTLHGQTLVLRFLDKKRTFHSLEDLGYEDYHQQALKNLVKKPEGLVIFTGPTGSGKTTSLYGLLKTLQDKNINMMTLEEPVECPLPFLRQSLITKEGMNFSQGLHSLLRQDPDVILLGEIRDEESAHMALRAAMTGHLVLTTLHTTHSLGVFHRFQEFHIAPSLLASVLQGIVAQRLVRFLCPLCKRKENPHETKYRTNNDGTNNNGTNNEINNGPNGHNSELWMKSKLFVPHPEGCFHCSYRGYKGRFALLEILSIDDDFREFLGLHEKESVLFWKDFLKKRGQDFLEDHGQKVLLQGKTSLEEIQRTTGFFLIS